MKKIFILLLITILGVSFMSAQNNTNKVNKADAICGFYYVVDPFSREGSQVKIYKNKENNTYEAIVVWVENPKKKPYLGYTFLKGFTYNEEKEQWVNGTIHHPGNGKTYKSFMNLEGPNKLRVKGYVGYTWLGVSMHWNRETQQRRQE